MRHGVGQRRTVADRRGVEPLRPRRRDGQGGQVAGDLQHHGLPPPERQVDGPIDQPRRVDCVLDGEGTGRHLGVDLPLVVVAHLAQRVMDQAVLRPGVAVDPADDDEHGQVLGVGTGHGVEGAEAADAVAHDEGRDPVGARIAVGRVAGVQLVAAPDHLEAGVGQELVEQDQVEVAGDDEVRRPKENNWSTW